MASGNVHYHPKDAVKNSIQAALVTGGAGAFAAAVQNSLAKRNHGAWGVFTKGAGTIAVFTFVGGAFVFTRDAAANLREKDDSINHAIGGFVGGSVIGLRSRSIPVVLGYGAMTAVLLSAFEFTGGRLQGYRKDKETDEFDRKEFLRKNRRIPIDETIAEIGEGRGIYPAGYDERRKQRIKEKYGIDVPAKSTHS